MYDFSAFYKCLLSNRVFPEKHLNYSDWQAAIKFSTKVISTITFVYDCRGFLNKILDHSKVTFVWISGDSWKLHYCWPVDQCSQVFQLPQLLWILSTLFTAILNLVGNKRGTRNIVRFSWMHMYIYLRLYAHNNDSHGQMSFWLTNYSYRRWVFEEEKETVFDLSHSDYCNSNIYFELGLVFSGQCLITGLNIDSLGSLPSRGPPIYLT